MINYQQEEDFFMVTFKGTILFDDIIAYLNDFRKIGHLPKNLKILYDFAQVDFDFAPVKIKTLLDKAIEATMNYESIRTAFIVLDPKVTAYIMLFSSMDSNEKSSIEIFSTKSAAIDWIKGYR